jgi:hypothetical protein
MPSTSPAAPSAERRRAPALAWSPNLAVAAVSATVALGVAFRLVQYVANRSLWLDEALLSLNVLDRSAARLVDTLDFDQLAPIGFVEGEKLVTHLFGASELSLRLLPLAFGLIALPVFALLAWRVAGAGGAAIASCVLACAPGAVYYASEVKQYSSDLAVAVVLLALGIALLDPGMTPRRRAVVAVIGAVAIPFSTSSVFIAGGVIATLAGRYLLRRDRASLVALYPVLAWTAGALAFVLFTVARSGHLQAALAPPSTGAGEARSFSSYSSSHLRVVRQLASAIWRSAGYPDSAPERYLHWPLVALALIGAIALARRRPAVSSMLVLPFAAVGLASALHRYPIFDRTVLFLVPSAILLFAEGAVVVASALRGGAPRRAAFVGVAAAVVVSPLVRGFDNAANPIRHEEVKSAMSFILARWQPADGLVVDEETRYTVRYYLDCSCLSRDPESKWTFGQTHGQNPDPLTSVRPRFLVADLGVTVPELERRLGALRGRPRVWLLYSHVGTGTRQAQIEQLLQTLDRRGKQLAAYRATGAAAYLYDLRFMK